MNVNNAVFAGVFSAVVMVLSLAACGNGGTSTGDAKAGETLATQNVCASCHQSNAAGAGVLAGGDMVITGSQIYGPNLTPDMDTGIGSWTDDQISKALLEGVDDEGATLCAIMPKFAFTEQQVADMIAYLRSLPAVKNEVPEGSCE